jgi:hypothetical protein
VNAAELARSRQTWRAAEARVYPLAMTDVDGYQRALVLVAAVCEQLRALTTTSFDLPAMQDRAVELVAAACDATGTSVRGLEPDDIFGSAAAVRDRELAGEAQRLARVAAIADARAAGAAWAEQHADSLGTRVPELRIEVATGWAILTELGGDPTTGEPVLLVTTAHVDPVTGHVRVDPDAEVHSVASADEWARTAAALEAAAG